MAAAAAATHPRPFRPPRLGGLWGGLAPLSGAFSEQQPLSAGGALSEQPPPAAGGGALPPPLPPRLPPPAIGTVGCLGVVELQRRKYIEKASPTHRSRAAKAEGLQQRSHQSSGAGPRPQSPPPSQGPHGGGGGGPSGSAAQWEGPVSAPSTQAWPLPSSRLLPATSSPPVVTAAEAAASSIPVPGAVRWPYLKVRYGLKRHIARPLAPLITHAECPLTQLELHRR